MSRQKILYSHGKKFLIHVFEKISQLLDPAVFLVVGLFPGLSFGFPHSNTSLPALPGRAIQFESVHIGHSQFGQSNLIAILDNNQNFRLGGSASG